MLDEHPTEDADPGSARFDVWWIDVVAGRETRHTVVDVTAALNHDELRGDLAVPNSLGRNCQLLPDGRTLMVWTSEYLADHGVVVPGNLLAVDLDNPEVAPRRYDLPPSKLGTEHRRADGSSNFDPGESRSGLSVVPDGLQRAADILAGLPSGEGIDGRVIKNRPEYGNARTSMAQAWISFARELTTQTVSVKHPSTM